MGHMASIPPAGGWRALDELVSQVMDTRAQIAALQAREAGLLNAATDLVVERTVQRRAEGRRIGNDLPLREVCSELGAAMRLSDRTVQARMSDAATVTVSFPSTFEAWSAGRIDAQHVAAIIDSGSGITCPEVRARYERQLLDAAADETPSRLRKIAQVVAARLDPATTEERHLRARADRRVRVIDLEDSTARLLADGPATLIYGIYDRLTDMAHDVRGAGIAPEPPPGSSDTSPADTRTMDELRADILADLLLTGAPTGHGDGDALAAISAHVQITIPVLTAAGLSNEPALLAGHGPIDTETALCLAADAPGWDRVMFHPHTGAPLAVDRYRPSAELRRFLRVRDEHCRFPGCTQPPWRCDADHTIDAAKGGHTSECNLALFCRRHHTVKHATAWTVRQLGGGILEWTSITGRTYPDRPVSTVQFVPSVIPPGPNPTHDGDPPPF